MKYLNITHTLRNKDIIINVRTEVISHDGDEVLQVLTNIIGINSGGKWFNPEGVGKTNLTTITNIEHLKSIFRIHDEAIREHAADIVTKVTNMQKLVKTIYEVHRTEVEGYWPN